MKHQTLFFLLSLQLERTTREEGAGHTETVGGLPGGPLCAVSRGSPTLAPRPSSFQTAAGPAFPPRLRPGAGSTFHLNLQDFESVFSTPR